MTSSESLGPIPAPAASVEETMAAFDTMPLFMKSLPEEGLEDSAVSALQSLVHEGTPDEIAQNFKTQGNEYFKGKRHRDAMGFYTQGLEAKPKDSKLLEALLINRAACNLELKNHGSVLKDCSKALIMNPRSSKAYYRSATSLLALERFEEALDCCNRCLEFDADNIDIQDLRKRISQLEGQRRRREAQRQAQIEKKREEERKLYLAFQARNLIVVKNPDGPADNPYSPHFDPEDQLGQTLIMPTFFLYPQYATSDVISHFAEDTPFAAHITAMFPLQVPTPSWDRNHEYIDGNLTIYAITHKKRLLKIGKKMTLKDVFAASKAKTGEPRDGLEVKDGCLTFIVLPRGGVEKTWIEEFKQARNSQ